MSLRAFILVLLAGLVPCTLCGKTAVVPSSMVGCEFSPKYLLQLQDYLAPVVNRQDRARKLGSGGMGQITFTDGSTVATIDSITEIDQAGGRFLNARFHT